MATQTARKDEPIYVMVCETVQTGKNNTGLQKDCNAQWSNGSIVFRRPSYRFCPQEGQMRENAEYPSQGKASINPIHLHRSAREQLFRVADNQGEVTE